MPAHPDEAAIDLDAYLRRIGHLGPLEPSLQLLRDLHRLHVGAIAFEAVDVLLGREVRLDPRHIEAKLVLGGRGGYCFEQNTLFRHALTALGFEVDSLTARSLWGRPPEDFRPRTHMALRVRLDGQDWLSDVGSPRSILAAPILLSERGPQATDFEPLRLVPIGQELRLEALASGEWRPVYDLVVNAQLDVDLLPGNWFASTHPTSPFRQCLIVSRHVHGVRYALLENQLSIRRAGFPAERRRLSAEQLSDCLRDDFGLAVDAGWLPVLRDAVTRGDSLATA